jgi:phage gp29-like protein
MLLTPGGATEPWLGGIWAAVCRDYARKTEALLNLDAWQRKHASPIRAATLPVGAVDGDYDNFLDQMIEWTGVNTAVCLTPGADLKLVETNGQGYQAYAKTVEMMNESLSVAIAGQSITTVGSQGFANGEVGLTVRGDLTKRYANDIATGFSEQLLPYVMAARYGSVDRQIALVLETDPPKDKAATARALTESASAISALVSAVTAAQTAGLQVYQPNISELMTQFGIPKAEVQTAVAALPAEAPAPAQAPAPVAAE